MTTNTITALVQIEVTNEKRNYAMGEAATMLNTLNSVKDISFPSINSAVTLDFNDAEFLGLLLNNYIKTLSFPSLHIIELAKKLHGNAGC